MCLKTIIENPGSTSAHRGSGLRAPDDGKASVSHVKGEQPCSFVVFRGAEMELAGL